MTTFEIVQLVIAIISIPVLVSILGWLNPDVRARHRLVRDLDIADRLPEGEERDIWLKVAEDRARELRQIEGSVFKRAVTWATVVLVVGLTYVSLIYWLRGTWEETYSLFDTVVTLDSITVHIVIVIAGSFIALALHLLLPSLMNSLKPEKSESTPKD